MRLRKQTILSNIAMRFIIVQSVLGFRLISKNVILRRDLTQIIYLRKTPFHLDLDQKCPKK